MRRAYHTHVRAKNLGMFFDILGAWSGYIMYSDMQVSCTLSQGCRYTPVDCRVALLNHLYHE